MIRIAIAILYGVILACLVLYFTKANLIGLAAISTIVLSALIFVDTKWRKR